MNNVNEQTFQERLSSYFQYANEANPSVSMGEKDNISRIYKNCVHCNTQMYATTEKMKKLKPGDHTQFCGQCWSKLITEFEKYMAPDNHRPDRKEATLLFEKVFKSFYNK